MAEFQDVMKQFDRMCWYYQRKRECPMGCPMNGVNISQCRKVAFEEPIVTEKTVMAWAAEHPEPKYPTWLEWLHDLGLIVQREGTFTEYGPNESFSAIKKVDILTIEGYQSIPADIAQKLGIEPKEG